MGVQGVGAKVALAIQGVLSAADLTQAVAAEDKAMVSRAPGVGPKVAQRIVQELKDKIPEAQFIASTGSAGDADGAGGKLLQEALSALTNLGYQRVQANQALMAARSKLGDEADTIEALIKAALKEMS
jgi:Holliday junction DNA helicase RuvA